MKDYHMEWAKLAQAVAEAIIAGADRPFHYGIGLEAQAWIEGMIYNPSLAEAVADTSTETVAKHIARDEVVEWLHPMPPASYMRKMEAEMLKYAQMRFGSTPPVGCADEDEEPVRKLG